nr:GMC oxidoreductase [Burkholderia ambifaria]
MARHAHDRPFASLDGNDADALLHAVQQGRIDPQLESAWAGMDSRTFFGKRVLMDLCGAYYSHPFAWNEIGFGGPATSVVDSDCRSWDIPNLWVCDGSVFPTVGGVNPSLTIQAIACRTADRVRALVARGDAHARARWR